MLQMDRPASEPKPESTGLKGPSSMGETPWNRWEAAPAGAQEDMARG